jgi:outer membrane murein-binding lipoprotein Lpp
MKISRYMVLGAMIAGNTVLAGCSITNRESMAPNLGEAVKHNMALQIIDPTAGEKVQPAATLEGQKAEETMKRYRKESGKTPTQRLILEVGG